MELKFKKGLTMKAKGLRENKLRKVYFISKINLEVENSTLKSVKVE